MRAVFSFLIASTNMNAFSILILFWSLLGWKFAFAELFGGVIIIAIVAGGLSAFGSERLARLQGEFVRAAAAMPAATLVKECPICGMEGERAHAVAYRGTTYRCCGATHARALAVDPQGYRGASTSAARTDARGLVALRSAVTWMTIARTAMSDVAMLRNELVVGYVIAGFAAALVPAAWLASVLRAVGGVPGVGSVLLLLVGLLLAVATFVCSMGNVPIARSLAARLAFR